MKIIIIHRRNFQERPPVISVYSHLIKLGHNPILITAGINDNYRELLRNNKTQYHVVPFSIKSNQIRNIVNGFLWGRKVRRLIKELAGDKQVLLWIEGNYTFDNLTASFINKYPHILQHQELFRNPMSNKGRYTMHTLKRVMPSALVNIAPEYNRSCIYQALFSLKEKPVVLPNKPSFLLSEEEINNLMPKYADFMRLIGDRKIILYQGILSKERNLENFIRATSELDNTKYVTVLLGKKTPLVDEYKALNVNLIHIDYIPAPDYLFFTSKAYIGIVTYLPDSLNSMYCAPNKLFEYGAYGVPMLGNNIAGLKYTIEFNGCGVVCDENSVEDIRKSIERIICNYSDFSSRAKLYYQSTNNLEIVKQIIEISENKMKK